MFFSSWQFNHWNEEFSISHKIFSVGAFEPDFVIPLENVTVAQGRDATFTCVVNNLGGHRVSGDGASTPAKVCIGFQSQMRFDLQHTHKQSESLNYWPTYRLSITVYYFVLYSISFSFHFQAFHTFTSALLFWVFSILQIMKYKLHHKNKSYRKLFTIHSSVHSYYVTRKRTYLKYLIRVYY